MRTVITAVCFTLMAALASAQHPDLTGNWILNEDLSQSPMDKIFVALGGAQEHPQGTRQYKSETRASLMRDGDKAATVRTLLDYASVMKVMEIEQSDSEIKIWVGDADQFFGLFYLDGKPHARQLDGGLRVEATAQWEGQNIRIEQVGANKAVLREIFSKVGDDQVALVFHLSSRISETPVQFRVVYDREKK